MILNQPWWTMKWIRHFQNMHAGFVGYISTWSIKEHKRTHTLTAIPGSEDPRVPANDTHIPSTSERVFALDIASFGAIPSFTPRTICNDIHNFNNYCFKYEIKPIRSSKLIHINRTFKGDDRTICTYKLRNFKWRIC